MVKYGLIGRGISHSFSPGYFNRKFEAEGIDARYIPFDLPHISDIKKIIADNPELRGLNVTSPYKREVIPYLDNLSPEAESLEAVNVIEFKQDSAGGNKLIGHNTDCTGFQKTLENFGLPHSKALVLGTGGASSAVALALKNLGIPYRIVSRNPSEEQVDYPTMNELIPAYNIIINATPVGMHPNENNCPDIDFSKVNDSHLFYDLIYNPAETLFLKKASQKGATVKNGLEMLLNQAELSWDIWNNRQ